DGSEGSGGPSPSDLNICVHQRSSAVPNVGSSRLCVFVFKNRFAFSCPATKEKTVSRGDGLERGKGVPVRSTASRPDQPGGLHLAKQLESGPLVFSQAGRRIAQPPQLAPDLGPGGHEPVPARRPVGGRFLHNRFDLHPM